MSKLDQEKDSFVKSIEGFKQTLEKIKKFHKLEDATVFSQDAWKLQEAIGLAQEKVQQFNEREGLFNQPKSEYPDLEEVSNSFKPFFELLDIAS